MAVSREQASSVTTTCIAEYLNKPPYDSYVSGVGISKVGFKEKDAPDKDDFCVCVTLLKKLPQELSIPKEIHGVKIFTTVEGEFRAI